MAALFIFLLCIISLIEHKICLKIFILSIEVLLIMYNLAVALPKYRGIFKVFNEKFTRNVFLNSKMHHDRPKVLITRAVLPGQGINKIREKCDVDIFEKDARMSKDELMRRIPGVDGLLCLATEKIDKDVIKAAGDQLKVIATLSTGYDHIDVKECARRNIAVSNTSGVNSNSVAEWTVMLMLCAGRRFPEATMAVKDGKWATPFSPSFILGKGLEDSVVGIVGMGKIGQAVMKRVLPFGVNKVLYHDIQKSVEAADEMGAIYAEFDELVRQSDFIVSTCNLTEKTKNMFNKDVFDRMKSTAVFVNTSRGEVVDQDDLYEALKYKIRAAAIDVTVPEPLPPFHKLNSLWNLIITPHLASSEKNVLIKMGNLAAENILLGVKGEPLLTPVTVPEQQDLSV